MAEKAKFFETIVLQLKEVDSKSTFERYMNDADAARNPFPCGDGFAARVLFRVCGMNGLSL